MRGVNVESNECRVAASAAASAAALEAAAAAALRVTRGGAAADGAAAPPVSGDAYAAVTSIADALEAAAHKFGGVAAAPQADSRFGVAGAALCCGTRCGARVDCWVRPSSGGPGRLRSVDSCGKLAAPDSIAWRAASSLRTLRAAGGSFGFGGGGILSVDSGDGLPLAPGWRCGRWLAGDAEGESNDVEGKEARASSSAFLALRRTFRTKASAVSLAFRRRSP